MSLSHLVQELTAAIQQQKDNEADLVNKRQRLKELESQCSGLSLDAQRKRGAINDALEPADVEEAKKIHAEALERIESHDSAIENLKRYLAKNELGHQITQNITELKKQVLEQRYDDLIEALELTDDQLALMREFVVIGELATYKEAGGYGVGGLASIKYGVVMKDDWLNEKNRALLAMGVSEETIRSSF